MVNSGINSVSDLKHEVTVFLVGDSTVADYSSTFDNEENRLNQSPITGWGEAFKQILEQDTKNIIDLFGTETVVISNHAKEGRSTRTFFQEGRWRSVYSSLKNGDFVFIQFGHNDSSQDKPERYISIEGYKEFLRLFVSQTKEKGATPILLTPVCRNYPWIAGRLESAHGEYPEATREVADEMDVRLIDLTDLSKNWFSKKGEEYVSNTYFMNLPANMFEAYPNGLNDNTHFQPDGAKVIAMLVIEEMNNKGLKMDADLS